MTKLILARHGESEANVLHVFSNLPGRHGLTEIGRRQAEALAARLESFGAQRLVCSPLERAIQTAQIVGANLGLKPVIDPDLIEFDVGTLEGRSDPQAWEEYVALTARWSVGLDLDSGMSGGESPRVMSERLGRVLSNARSHEGTLVAITHGGLLRMALPLLLTELGPGYFVDRHIEPARYSVIDYADNGWRLDAWNE